MRGPFKEQEATRPSFPVACGSSPQFELSKTPDPDWRPGQGLNSLPLSASHHASQPRRELDPDSMTGLYKALISGVTPRPIAFVSTVSADGVPNLAPYSFFNLVSASPPLVSVSISPGGARGDKDTYQNIVATNDFTVSMISETFLESANYTAVDSPPSVSEWDLSGLTPVPSSVVKPARVGESVFAVECTLHHEWAVTDDNGKETGGHVVFGRIRKIHVLESAWDSEEGILKPEESAIVSRLGGIRYGRTTQGCELPRMLWASEKDKPEVQEALA